MPSRRSPVLGVFTAVAILAFGVAAARAQAPSNDLFANAWTVSGATFMTNGSNVNASKEAGEPNHAGNQGGRSVWFHWTAPTNGTTQIDTIGSSFDTLLAVYTGNSVSALTVVASNNNAPGLGNLSQVQFTAIAGTTYRIVVDAARNFFNPPGGNYVLNLAILASVNITSPTNGTLIYSPNPINVNVSATVPSPPIQRIEFYRTTNFLGSDSTSPYSFSITNAPFGTNSIYAVAIDNTFRNWTSAVVNVTYLNLGVTISSPADGSIFLNTNPITVSVVASVPSGAITNVDFLVDDQKFAQDSTAPFSVTWTAVQGGLHRLTAIGKHNSGVSYTSPPVTVSFPRAILPVGSVWKYLDNGTDQGTNWIRPTFDDSTWASGPAELGYGDGDEATTVSYGTDPDNKYITTYFRNAFLVSNAANYTNLIVRTKRDDGAVVYLNGVEVQRLNMPSGAINYLTPGLLAGDDGTSFYAAFISASSLVEGRNVIAVEIHQNDPTSDDISFDLQLEGVLKPGNQAPLVSISSPTNGAVFVGPSSLTLSVNASDSDGHVAKVSYFTNGVLLGESTTGSFDFAWNNPAPGWYTLRAFAVDDLASSAASAEIAITVYDSAGSPIVQITSPTDGTTVEGPTNMVVTANAAALGTVTNVQFLANGVAFDNDASSPFSGVWNAPFGNSTLSAVAADSSGRRGTSGPVNVTITIPPTNTVPPTVYSQTPSAGALVTSLTSVRVIFSERVSGVDASDLLLNGVPATQVTGTGGSNYLFTVAQPPYGIINVTWAAGHGIQDFGYPSSLPFDENDPSATWAYNLVDRTPPTVATRNPAAGATVTNLTDVTVTFSENVIGVDASDFLVNGVPAYGMSGGGSSYIFSFSQPASGPVNITWANNHGISDLADSPNAFNASGSGATWSYTLDARTTLVQSNSNWLLLKGTAEASSPTDAWRTPGFNTATWANSFAPFYFGDTGYTNPATPGTVLGDMLNNYTSVYLRKTFNVPNASLVTNLYFNAQSDDGFIAWINGVEVLRYNMPAGQIPFNGVASITAPEPNGNGAGYIVYTLPDPATYLVDGNNVLAVQAFNQAANSSDFGFNAQLYTYLFDPSVVVPRVAGISPPVGTVFYFTNVIIRFSEPVSGVDPGDLVINGSPATTLVNSNNIVYTFGFPQPPFGAVTVQWASGHGIVDFDTPPKAFSDSSTYQYNFLNPSSPLVAAQTPSGGNTIISLTQIAVVFTESVTGVNASDLLINGVPASGLTGSGANYTFTFPQPAYGPVSVSWVVNHGIQDLDVPPNAFDVSRPGSTWNYTLVDQTAPTIASLVPPAGTQVTNLTQVTVTFSEPVVGVNASDLRVNGNVATAVSGGPTVYTFTLPQANANLLNFTWANNHGIRDLAAIPNSFDATAAGATWFYSSPDTLPPSVGSIDPPAFITLGSLSEIRVMFSEPVTGVDKSDLLINGVPALTANGSGAGPYVFTFPPPSSGLVQVRWAGSHGIMDLGLPSPNAFAGGEWSYTLDPSATFAGKVLINEIMFNPLGGRPADEWIELRNVSSNAINVTGWRFSRGVAFTFPQMSIDAGAYLVVAADVSVFQAKYPTVANVIGGWTGGLGNGGETIELETALGEQVNRVHYATEGDWGRREHDEGAELVTSIVRSGSTATVTIFAHGYTGNDQVLISGADQPEYNGRFTISGVGPSTFQVTISGTPASPATGRIIARQVLDDNVQGWSWFSEANGFGSSLELVNPALPNTFGQNWSSSTLGGTPGRANSAERANIAPLISEVTHFPPVPRSTDSVAITARVQDESASGIQSVTLFFRNHTSTGPGLFISTNMFDDGGHGDGLNRDGIYGAVLPAAANGTVIEFYVRALDTNGLARTWPAPAWEPDNTFAQSANALYQVDNEVIGSSMPVMRIVMSGTERAIFPPGNRNSDGEMNNTLISTDGDGTKIRYLAGVRVRGAGSRSRTPPNNRLDVPNDNLWNGYASVNLNGQFVHAQIMGAAVARKAGVPASGAHLIQYRINGVNPAPIAAPGNGGNGAGYGTFLLVEPVNGDLAANLYPEDGDGNVYRASSGNHAAQLNNLGTNAVSYLGSGYFKTSNRTENDWTDLINLVAAFNYNGSDAGYLETMSTNVNAEAWMRYFALGTLFNYGETGMFNGIGDDYALYRGIEDSRFVPIGHDFDTIFGQGDTVDNPPGTGYYPVRTNASIYIMLNPPNTGGGGQAPNMTVLRRFFTNNVFAPIFFGELKRLCDTVFNPAQLNPVFDELLNWPNGPTATTISDMKTYAANRRSVVLSQIPLTLTIGNSLVSSNGFAFSSTPSVSLFGTSHAIDTRKVLINGVEATWAPWDARWTNTMTLQPGVNRVVVQSLNSNSVEFARATLDIWYDDGTVTTVSGAINSDTVWIPANGPYQITATVTIASGATLNIQPGTTVYLAGGAGIVVANGGRLLAEGADTARIRFTRVPGGANWGNITINGTVGSPESRISYAHFEFNANNTPALQVTAGTVFFDHLTFGNTATSYIHVDGASFVIQHCVFPSATGQFELVHGTQGIKAGGHGVFTHNFFGRAIGYNDTVDFTGGNRPGPIVQFIDNVFAGSDDDILDLDSTDAWVEHNIFLHCHRNGASPDSSSGVSGGADNADTSEITIVGNIFYDCDQAANGKQGNFYTLFNNTVVHQTHQGGIDTDGAVVILADAGTVEGAGMYLEGNIVYDAEKLVRNQTTSIVTFTNNLMPFPWTGPGGNNSIGDPLFQHVPQFSETTNFNSWDDAQVMWKWLGLRAGSPAAGTGPNRRDKGAVIPPGLSISGEPVDRTPQNTATLRVDFNRTGNGITAGFPEGSGYTQYRWRLDGGEWSAETPLQNPISLTGLSPGPHYVEVIGKRDSGYYQDDPIYSSEALITVSRTWTVDPTASPILLNEILASNAGAVNHNGTTPDVVELYNTSDVALDLTGVRLTDDPSNPNKFSFPAGATIPARGYLVAYANNNDGTPGYHLGFNLKQEGDSLYLFASEGAGGALLDSMTFGLQLADLSIGRVGDGKWALTVPTFGAANQAAATGDPRALRINEWLVIAVTPFDNDFIELLNTDAAPVPLGGLYISDETQGWPTRHQFPALSFIAGNAYLRLVADGDSSAGADHLNFSLGGDQGSIGLYLPDLTTIDCVWYTPQQPNISQGRSPNGGSAIVFFETPTPGAPNPNVTGPPPFGGALVINEVLAENASVVEGGRTPDWVELYNGSISSINLGNLSLSDDTLQPRRFVFAPGTTIPSGGYVRVLCDPNSTASNALVASFALKSTGGAVYLFDNPTSGGGLLNSIIYGIQTANLSIGRVPDGSTNWVLTTPTPNAANAAVPSLGDAANLRVNEWMADPPAGSDDWIEVYNPNPLPVALGGLYLSDDLNNRTKHRIASLSFIGTGTNAWLKFIADGNTGAGADHVNFSLRAAGEAVGVSSTAGALIDGYAFGAQQTGVSEGRFPDGSPNIVRFPGTESPGASNWRWLTNIVINEALTHTDLPLEDAIELRNLTGSPIDVGGWWLSDDKGTLQKYQLPVPTVIPANGFVVVYENKFIDRQVAAIPFALSSDGDEVVLSAYANNALTGYRTSVQFGAADNGVSFGRYVTSDGREEFVRMTSRTFGVNDPGSVEEFREGTGAPNAAPAVGPVVISEIMYHPPDSNGTDDVLDEFIELHNISTVPVQLYNTTNSWHLRDAIDFDFPIGTVIEPGGYLLVVSFDPANNPAALAAFRGYYHLNPSVPLVGPYTGKLANDNDEIELRKAGEADADGVPYILVERVRYYDSAPWPVQADGIGYSLQRIDDSLFGNDPANWTAAPPTPGPQAASLDADGDGMPDAWENAYNLDPRNPSDANVDSDGDGLTNLQEYLSGTNPRDPNSALRFTSITHDVSGQIALTFRAASNQTYSILWKESLDAATWTKLSDIPAGLDRSVTIVDPLPPAPTRVYRIVTPQPPGPANPQPAILSSPKSASVDFDGSATLSVMATGSGPLTYQWSLEGVSIPGASDPALIISNADFSRIGSYTVTVRDGGRSASSSAAFLGVPPHITGEPQNQTATPGEPVTLTVADEAAGPVTYIWLHNGRPISAQTNSTLTVPSYESSDAGRYSVIVTHIVAGRKFAASSATAMVTAAGP